MDEYRITLDAGGLNRDFVFIGGPLEAPSGKETLFEALGFACAQWARMEQHLDALLMHINSEAHSETIFTRDHPFSFTKKIHLCKKWFNGHPALAPLQDDVRLLTSKLKELSPHRNNLIHGSLEQWDGASSTAQFCTLKATSTGEFTISTHTYTVQAILYIAGLVALSNGYLSGITRTIFTTDALQKLSRSSSHVEFL